MSTFSMYYLILFWLSFQYADIDYLSYQLYIVYIALNGGEEYISTHVNTCEDIVKWVEYLRGRSGYPIERLRKYHHTDYPSIQGPWTPWIHRHPGINIKEYPCVSCWFLIVVMFNDKWLDTSPHKHEIDISE